MKLRQQPIGLAPGGGGALGFAHVPALQALDELGLRPGVIAGTSMGVIIGAFYAGGHSGAEIEAFLRRFHHRRGELLRRLWRSRPHAVRNLFGQLRSTAGQLAAEEVLRAFGDFLPERFEQLRVPLKVITTDYYGAREQVFSSGALVKAVAASMALPFIFCPVVIGGRPLVDGGVVNPLPFEHAALPGGIVIAVNVIRGPSGAPPRIPRRLEAIVGAAEIQMQAITTEKLRRLGPPDILIESPIERFGPLEFGKVAAILDAAAPIKDELRQKLEQLLG